MKAANGGFMYPTDKVVNDENKKPFKLAGHGGVMHLYGVKVSHEGDYDVYKAEMTKEENKLKDALTTALKAQFAI